MAFPDDWRPCPIVVSSFCPHYPAHCRCNSAWTRCESLGERYANLARDRTFCGCVVISSKAQSQDPRVHRRQLQTQPTQISCTSIKMAKHLAGSGSKQYLQTRVVLRLTLCSSARILSKKVPQSPFWCSLKYTKNDHERDPQQRVTREAQRKFPQLFAIGWHQDDELGRCFEYLEEQLI